MTAPAESNLVEEIKEVQRMIAGVVISKKDSTRFNAMVLRIARFQPFPSKLNAVGILKANPAERVAKYLQEWEAER
jgi:hypothetical protein